MSAAESLTEKQLELLRNNAEEIRNIAHKFMQRALSYNEESVEWLTGYIDRMRSRLDAKGKDGLTNVIGAFLGECIIRNIGGQWMARDGMVCVQFDDTSAVFPFNKVTKQLKNGTEGGDSILGLYQTIAALRAEAEPPTALQQRLLKFHRDEDRHILYAKPELTRISKEAEYIAALRGISADDCFKSGRTNPKYLRIPKPLWVKIRPFSAMRKFFDQYYRLWDGGRVVWAHVVQANYALFDPGQDGAPGELVYDPSGNTGPNALSVYAKALGRLKGTKPEDPALRRIADHLTNEHTRVYGLPVPASIAEGGILLSTTFFHRPHLPGGVLSQNFLPVLIHDRYHGIVAVLPQRWWPDSILGLWDDA